MKSILALLADFANGIFAVLLASYVYQTEPLWWYFIVGMVLAMFPDIDAVPELIARGKVAASALYSKDHRTFLHYPILSVSIGLIAWYVFGFWGLVLLAAFTLHLINDLYGTGWGIPLLYPFTRKRYKCNPESFFKRRTLPAATTVSSWSESELQQAIKVSGNDNWLADTYLTLNWISITEYSLFIIAIIGMTVSLLY